MMPTANRLGNRRGTAFARNIQNGFCARDKCKADHPDDGQCAADMTQRNGAMPQEMNDSDRGRRHQRKPIQSEGEAKFIGCCARSDCIEESLCAHGSARL